MRLRRSDLLNTGLDFQLFNPVALHSPPRVPRGVVGSLRHLLQVSLGVVERSPGCLDVRDLVVQLPFLLPLVQLLVIESVGGLFEG